MKFSESQSMATFAIVLTCFFSLVAARPLDISGSAASRHLLQEGACPPQMSQCFTTPYQAQYFCCDSSANLQCSGGPDFQCSNYIDSSAPLVPASLIPVVPGLATPAPIAAAKAASVSDSSPTNSPSNPSPTNPPSNPSPTNPPSNPAPTNPPNNPAPANPAPTNPAPTNPAPTNPPPTNPPNTPAPVQNPPSTAGFRTGFATWYTDPNNANYFRTACYFNNPQNKPDNNMIVALPPHLFGVGPGQGNGPGCGTYWEVKCVGTLKRIGDGLYPGNERGACRTDKSIIVKGGDLCPECDEPRNDICQAADQPYCPGPQGYTPGQPGEHIDLTLAAFQVIGNNPPVTGIIKILFRQVGPVPDSQLGVPF